MGQFDSETEAALTQLNFEELAKIPGGEFAEIVNDLLGLIGVGGPFALVKGVSDLILKIRRLAGASYASNLIYTINAVAHDLKSLRESGEELCRKVDALPKNPQFAEAISALALRAMQTAVKTRLQRLARIIVNGVREDDLELEGLDDMMRAAVELKEQDIILLKHIYESQKKVLSSPTSSKKPELEIINTLWSEMLKRKHIEVSKCRGSLTRLEASALIQQRIIPGFDYGSEVYVLLQDGAKFYEHLREIAAESAEARAIY